MIVFLCCQKNTTGPATPTEGLRQKTTYHKNTKEADAEKETFREVLERQVRPRQAMPSSCESGDNQTKY